VRMACKPDSVAKPDRVVCVADGHSSRPRVAARLVQPTRIAWAGEPRAEARHDPYLALLLTGLAVPPSLPSARWALTPPFHPSRADHAADYSLWRFPSGFPGRALPAVTSPWSPDFPRTPLRASATIRPSARVR
jgi:hypothetical protein